MQCLYKTLLFRIWGSGVFVSFPDNNLTSKKLCVEYNHTASDKTEKRREILSKPFGTRNENAIIEPLFIAYGNPCKVRREIIENDRINPIKL